MYLLACFVLGLPLDTLPFFYILSYAYTIGRFIWAIPITQVLLFKLVLFVTFVMFEGACEIGGYARLQANLNLVLIGLIVVSVSIF